jgi:hypothetical protein
MFTSFRKVGCMPMSPQPRQGPDNSNKDLFLILRDYVLRSDNDNRFESLQKNIDTLQASTNDDIGEIKDDLKSLQENMRTLREADVPALRQAIVEKQEETYKRIILVQAAILIAVLTGVVSLIVYYIQQTIVR